MSTWVYIRTEKALWTVGFYDPDNEWHSDSDHATKEAAAERVHWLNGGDISDDDVTLYFGDAMHTEIKT